MNKKPHQTSLRRRLLSLVVGITVIFLLAITSIVVVLSRNIIKRAQETSSQSLREQAETSLVQLNKTVANQNDLILDRAARDVITVAEAATMIFEEELSSDYWPADKHMYQGENGQYLNSAEDTSSVFVPVTRQYDEEVQQEIELTGYLDLTMEPVFRNNPNAAAIYFGTSRDVTRYYPNIELGKVVPPDFQVSQRIWYTSSVDANLDPTHPKPVWSPVYWDATGLGLVTTVAIPVFSSSGELIGVVGLDITLDEINHNIENASEPVSIGYTFLIDQDGNSIILPKQGYLDILGRPAEPDEFGVNLEENISMFSPIINQMVEGESGFGALQVGNRSLFVAFSPIKSTDWSLGSVVDADQILEILPLLQNRLSQTSRKVMLTNVLPLTLLLSILMALYGLLWIRKLTDPIRKLATASESIGSGQWEVDIPMSEFEEIGLLAKTISKMKDQLSQTFRDLEHRVAERTADLENRALQLQTSAEVMRIIASERDLDPLLTKITQLISERFGYYHTGIFLLDSAGENIVLRAANSPGGQKMLARGHRLRVGYSGIVGTVAETKKPRITTNVKLDDVYYNNPDLPETKSEMAFPLLSEEVLLGVLDVQSKEEVSSPEEDIFVLQILADQIAIAIENAQLFSEKQQAIEELQLAYGQMSMQGWHNLLLNQPEISYYCLENGVLRQGLIEPDENDIDLSTNTNQNRNGKVTSLPLKIRDQVLGVIKFHKPQEAPDWTREEISYLENLCDQMSIALESARLFDEARLRAERERLTSEITSKVRSSNDPQVILQTAIRELSQALNASHINISFQEEEHR